MTHTVSKARFKARALEYFRKIELTGEELVITNYGVPVLKIVPYVADTETPFEGLRRTVTRFDDPLEPVGADDWEANQ